uniref:Strictosidine synthase conserved region domain-containing protein n=1 Tax=Ciona savignyi TaxID=51511 RepID=H2Y826_CIOSA
MDDKHVRRRKVSLKSSFTGTDSTTNRSAISAEKTHGTFNFCTVLILFATSCLFVILGVGLYLSPLKNAVIIDGLVNVELTGVYAINSKLSVGKRIENIPSPECIVEGLGGKLYTGLADGRIVCIHPSSDGEIGAGKVENITTGIIQGAAMSTDALGHGRPFGIRLVGKTLYAADAVYGLYTVDIVTKHITILVSTNAKNPPLKFTDDLDITADGNFIYFSDATHNPITHYHLDAYSGICSGRIFRYNTISKRLDEVISGLCFANGVQLSNDEHQLVVVETTRNRIIWYDIETWQPHNVVNVPFLPDNVRMTDSGTYLVAGSGPFLRPWIKYIFFNFPSVRKSMTGLLSSPTLFRTFQNLYAVQHVFVIELSVTGEVLNVMQDADGRLAYAIATATPLSDGRLALGSWHSNHIAIVDTT